MAPPGLLYNTYRLSYLGVMRPERDAVPSPGAEVKDIVKLYLYSPSVVSWHAIQCCCAFMAHYTVFFPPLLLFLQNIYMYIYICFLDLTGNLFVDLQSRLVTKS